MCRDYGYSVVYDGIGKGPEGSEHLGFCSQMAIFTREGEALDSVDGFKEDSTPYETVRSSCREKFIV